MPRIKHASQGGRGLGGPRYSDNYAVRKVFYCRIIDFHFSSYDGFIFEQWFEALDWKDYFQINVPYYVEVVKEFYSNLSSVGDGCNGNLEIKTKVNKVTIKFNDQILGNILNVPTRGSKFFETKKWPNNPELVLEDCLRVSYPNKNLFDGMAKPTNILNGEHTTLHHITTTHILPTSGDHKKMSYQDLYVIWHIVNGRPLNLPHLVMKNMLRATTKVDGALPYGMVITKIITRFGIFIGNKAPSKIDVGDIYIASSLK
ncbi:hypothetical protein CFOL_v3_09931 [Cephalotus follicularis]|uniref:Putative plant transposon protein domain-containing protein n=1 Tax=Cephalotus follicularis TaxID=3775 RepID=A0A1Q3BEJ6_CEPFO|nr:hypothetical protein CFOL_v3_09931 [Cephalotus follicularis]